MSKKLKPCPFCGSKPKWVKAQDTFGDYLIEGWKLECSSCWCSPLPNNYYGDKNKAIEKWNNRWIKNNGSDNN